jgi:outer membrane protein assembly factor BamB
MNTAGSLLLFACGTAAGMPAPAGDVLLGSWQGTVSHEGETQPLALRFERADGDQLVLKATIPAIHCGECPLGHGTATAQGNEIRFGPFRFGYDAAAGTLAGTVPESLVPVYHVPFTLRRVESIDLPARPEPSGPLAGPIWTFDAGSPLWPGPVFVDGVVYAGAEDGRLHALDATTGKERWAFRAAGPIRTRATLWGGSVFFQADDGFVYRVQASSGKEEWRARIVDRPIRRLPFDDPKSRYDRFGSDVTVVGGRLYLGTHDGKLLVLDAAKGGRIWEFAAEDSVLAAPTVEAGRIYFGSFDRQVYALEAATGKLLWKHDTQGAVVSTPALDPKTGLLVVGSRSYDLLGLDVKTGTPAWKRYVWFSWVESSAALRDGVAYVGSSDAARLFAFEVATGRRLWDADTYGWTWGQPAVSAARVYVGTSSLRDYGPGHQGGAWAVDRATGRPAWRFVADVPASGTYGFPGSPALGAGLVFLGGLDGRIYAFAQ